jgi:arylsulfatase A-like enzyme
MEVYAGFMSFTDHHFGRILDFLRETGELDNTLVIVVSDNGASSEGGPVGSLNEMFFFNNARETLEDNLKMIDKLGGVETLNHYAKLDITDLQKTHARCHPREREES